MKLIFTFALAIIFSRAFSQSKYQIASKKTLYISIQTPDGGVISTAPSGVDSIYLMKVNAKAQTIWTKNVSAPGARLVSLINTAEGGFALGLAEAVSNSDRVGLYKFDANANLLWAKSYSSANGARLLTDFNFGAVLQAADGGYFIACAIYGDGVQNDIRTTAIGLIKTDGSGNKLWAKTYFSYAENTIVTIKPTLDGNYVFLASIIDSHEVNDSAFVVKINPSGTILWSKYFTELTYYGSWPYSITPVSDGGYIIAQLIEGEFLGITKLDASGNTLWSKANLTVSANSSYNFDYLSSGDMVETPDHSYVFAGNVSNSTGDSIFYDLIKFNHLGSYQWEKQFVNGTFNLVANGFTRIIRTADSGYLATGVGQTEVNGQFTAQTGMIFKFDSNFNSCKVPVTFTKSAWIDTGAFQTGNVVTGSTTIVASNDAPLITSGSSLDLICNDDKGSLPVTLVNFTAIIDKSDALLRWQTASEINTSTFKVQRSNDDQNFTEIGTVKASSNGNELHNYSYTDASVINLGAAKLYYRLKMVDADGAVNYSKILALALNSTTWVIILAPNPVRDAINITSSLNVPQGTITVTDMTGRVLTRFTQNLAAGQQIQIPAAQLAAGVYMVLVESRSDRKAFKVLKR